MPESRPMDAVPAAANPPPPKPTPRERAMKALKFLFRWGIAVLGIWWVLSQMSFSDTILVANRGDAAHPVVQRKLIESDANEGQRDYHVAGEPSVIPREDALNKPG